MEVTTTAGSSRVLQGATDIEIDTTINQTIDIIYKWSVADVLNNLTSRNFTIELVSQ